MSLASRTKFPARHCFWTVAGVLFFMLAVFFQCDGTCGRGGGERTISAAALKEQLEGEK